MELNVCKNRTLNTNSSVLLLLELAILDCTEKDLKTWNLIPLLYAHFSSGSYKISSTKKELRCKIGYAIEKKTFNTLMEK